jgi:hypothetical protein
MLRLPAGERVLSFLDDARFSPMTAAHPPNAHRFNRFNECSKWSLASMIARADAIACPISNRYLPALHVLFILFSEAGPEGRGKASSRSISASRTIHGGHFPVFSGSMNNMADRNRSILIGLDSQKSHS